MSFENSPTRLRFVNTTLAILCGLTTMHPSYQTILLLASVASLPASAAVARNAPLGSFRIDLVAKANSTAKNGLGAYARALRKYARHSSLKDEIFSKADALTEASSVVATSVGGDVEYIAPVTIGDQNFQLDFDTVFLPHSGCLWSPQISLSRVQISGILDRIFEITQFLQFQAFANSQTCRAPLICELSRQEARLNLPKLMLI